MDLTQLARKYIWWQAPEVSSKEPRRVIAHKERLVTATASVSAIPAIAVKSKMLATVR